MDYAEKDRNNMLEFIESRGGECDVSDIIECDSVEKFRVYPLIYRLEEDGVLAITDFSYYGAPLRVRLVNG